MGIALQANLSTVFDQQTFNWLSIQRRTQIGIKCFAFFSKESSLKNLQTLKSRGRMLAGWQISTLEITDLKWFKMIQNDLKLQRSWFTMISCVIYHRASPLRHPLHQTAQGSVKNLDSRCWLRVWLLKFSARRSLRPYGYQFCLLKFSSLSTALCGLVESTC